MVGQPLKRHDVVSVGVSAKGTSRHVHHKMQSDRAKISAGIQPVLCHMVETGLCLLFKLLCANQRLRTMKYGNTVMLQKLSAVFTLPESWFKWMGGQRYPSFKIKSLHREL